MALEEIGVRAVIEGLDSFRGDARDVQRLIDDIAGSARGAEGGSNIFSRALGFLGDTLHGIFQIAGGILTARIIERIGEALADVARKALSAASEFQKLRIQMEGLVAREAVALSTGEEFSAWLGRNTNLTDRQIDRYGTLRDRLDRINAQIERQNELGRTNTSFYQNLLVAQRDVNQQIGDIIAQAPGLSQMMIQAAHGTITYASALEMASGPAREMLNWIRQTAIETPFTAQSLSRVTALGMAMGFTSDQVRPLTLAVGNFTAGMGLTSDVMERIIHNFGQMMAAGKVTGTELRDLARGGFVPVNDVLIRMRDNLGMGATSFAAFRLAAAQGRVPVEEFFNAFIEIANEQFPNAMERMALTWEGVKQRATDFIQTVIGWDVIGPDRKSVV